jgi:hypothetical protein
VILEERSRRAFAKVPVDAPPGDYVHLAIGAVAGWLYERSEIFRQEAGLHRESTALGAMLSAMHLEAEASYMERLGRELVKGEGGQD